MIRVYRWFMRRLGRVDAVLPCPRCLGSRSVCASCEGRGFAVRCVHCTHGLRCATHGRYWY